MFTGIVEETGRITRIVRDSLSSEIMISAVRIFEDLKIGDSVSVNGVCLTASMIKNRIFCAVIMNETLQRSSLKDIKQGSKVNLERAMHAEGRFGGHMVSGHIDGTGIIQNIKMDGNAVMLSIEAQEKILNYVVEKGSIAIDGISLTVVDVSERYFRVSVIPHTWKETVLAERKTGDLVNLENDLIGKYVEKMLTNHLFSIKKMDSSENDNRFQKSALTKDFLKNHGF